MSIYIGFWYGKLEEIFYSPCQKKIWASKLGVANSMRKYTNDKFNVWSKG